MDDDSAWEKYPQHHKWFNKLYVAKKAGLYCGPGGVAPKHSGWYVVRPIYNIRGMSVGSSKQWINANDYRPVPPGYFWSQYIKGTHYSASYTFKHAKNPYWQPLSCWVAEKDESNNPIKFTKWSRFNSLIPTPPRWLNELSDVPVINVEFIADTVIEVHLRDSPDPDADEFIPVFANRSKSFVEDLEKRGYRFIPAYDDADGYLQNPRIGFMITGERR